MSEELRRLSKRKLVGLVEQLAARVDGLEERVQQLEHRNADLEAQLAKGRKDSSTSSKPPSSDIVKPPKRGQGGEPASGRLAASRGIPSMSARRLPPTSSMPHGNTR